MIVVVVVAAAMIVIEVIVPEIILALLLSHLLSSRTALAGVYGPVHHRLAKDALLLWTKYFYGHNRTNTCKK